MKRSIVYIDGFNLYYGAVRGTRWKWLDLQKLFELLRQDDHIQTIKYFTAEVMGSHLDNQLTYLSALNTLEKMQVYLGRFKMKQLTCRVRDCMYDGNRFFQMPEEKFTDVGIGVHMVADALKGHCDRLVLVSGDSDLVPAIEMVKEHEPAKEVIVYVPARNKIRGAAVEIRHVADKHRTLPMALIKKCQFPPQVPDRAGNMIVKPESW